MSVCVEGLIRNDFYDVDNIEAVEAELNRASQILNVYFHLEGEDKYQPYGLDCRDYQVYSETHHMFRMFLKKGYWHVSPAYRYHQLFTPPLFVRQGFYDLAKALGIETNELVNNINRIVAACKYSSTDVSTTVG